MKRSETGIVVGSSIGAVGAAVAAVLGTLCCAGPAVVGLVGVGGALAAARLEPFRPYFLVASAVLLAIGFWRSYRPRAAAPGVDGATCAIRTRRAVRAILWTSTAAGILALFAPRFFS
jgi:mercuric ion transport protein